MNTQNTMIRAAESGFSMIEILVTIVIISIALLGSAGLQAYSLKTNQGGQFRNQAAFLVADIVERMEANKKYAADTAALTAYGDSASTATSTTDCSSTNCTSAQLAAYDITQWKANIASAVPSGTGTVAISGVAGNPATYSITVNWLDRKTNTTYTAASTVPVTEAFSINTTSIISQ